MRIVKALKLVKTERGDVEGEEMLRVRQLFRS